LSVAARNQNTYFFHKQQIKHILNCTKRKIAFCLRSYYLAAVQLEFNQYTDSIEEETLFIEVILPLAVDGTFTYRVQRSLTSEVSIGKRVTVHFGKRHIYTGIITEVHHRVPSNYKVKYLLEVLDEEPLVSADQIKFWRWISIYYMCTLGEVMEAALPSYLKLKSETHIVLHPKYKDFISDLNALEALAIEALENENEMSLSDLQEFLHVANVMPVVRELHYKGLILTIEEIKRNYKPKTEKHIKLNVGFTDSETLTATFQILEEKKNTLKQSEILSTFLYLKKDQESVKKSQLLKEDSASASALNSLIKKGILDEFEVTLDRWKLEIVDKKDFELNEFQEKAFKEIKSGIHQLKPVLFHGITGSGKTLVYLKLLENYISDHDKQALYLVPEIALTTQLLSRLAAYFGDSIAVYHSRLSNSERYELWMGIKLGKYKLIVGARSAIFLPFKNLRMIVVDEEHEASFKQQDPAPRYNSRDAAIYLSHQLQIPVILGSATPSLESYHNAQIEKYHYVYLGKRFGDVMIPKIKLIDLREEQKTNSIQGNISRALKNICRSG